MTSSTVGTTATRGVEKYLHTERALWSHYGLEPKERFVQLASPSVRLRVLEVGSGDPVLFVHGTVGPGGWPSLIGQLPGHRCIVLDRPGWGMSAAVDYSRSDYATLVSGLLSEVLNALGVERAHIVGGSIGNVWALRLAAKDPARVGRVVLLGGSPLVPEAPVPGIIRLLASPLGAVMVRLPDSPGRLRSILTQSGHGPSLSDGRIPDVFVDWRVALGRETNSMRHERDMVCALVSGRSYRPGLTFTDAELRAIEQPTLYVYGTADPVGTTAMWRRVTDVLPRGELLVLDGVGHMPWFDDVTSVAEAIGTFIADDVTS